MSEEMPLISFIIPSYNRVDLLKRLLDSIDQIKYNNMEIILIDDHSTSNYSDIVSYYKKKLRLIYIKNEYNLYAEKSRRIGFYNSTGEYVVFCDDDDFYTEFDYFADAINKLTADQSLAFVAGNAKIYKQFNGQIQEFPLNIHGKIDGISYLKNFQIKYNKPLSTFTTVFRRKVIEDTNVFFNDSSLYLFALMKGNAFIMDTIIGNYCVHSENISSNASIDFMIDVFDSKYYVYQVIRNSVPWNASNWWTKQIIITARFYLNSGIKDEKAVFLIKRIVQNKYRGTYNYMKFNLFCYIQYFKKLKQNIFFRRGKGLLS